MPDNTDHQRGVFDAVDSKQDFVRLEEETLAWWEAEGVVKAYLERNAKSPKRYSFFDGPITANNAMGVHHAWGRFYKDAFHRFRNMQGYRQRFQNGFDGQGLWVEVEVEKSKGFKSKRDIETYGIARFVNDCKQRVRDFADVITRQSQRLAYFMDWDNSYHTMSDANNYAIWEFLQHCHRKGWLYEGRDVMPWCPRCATGLSQHEIVTDGYREVEHLSLYVTFPLIDASGADTGEHLLLWTTTPWTLPANVFASVNTDLTYVKVRNTWDTAAGGETRVLWLTKNRLSVLKGSHEVLEERSGADLLGWRYRGPFDELEVNRDEVRASHRILAWDGANDQEGTGIVHSAPSAGPDDYQLGKEAGMPLTAVLDEEGRYFPGYGELSGRFAGDARDDIVAALRAAGALYRTERYKHRYPFCWRCSTELVYRLVSEWFISMDGLRQPMMDATNEMRWTPAFGRERELDWLRNMGDWMVSKKRYWGLALPIFKCAEEGCGAVEVIGSRDELKQRAIAGWDEFEGNSPHRPWLDGVRIACPKCSKPVARIRDVGNPWLDAGIIPFSTLSRDPASPEHIDQWYPANWFSESFPGQFRNWFYSLIAMSVALTGKRPADAVFSYALMRDENGQEMHKSRGNAILFEAAAADIGVDVMRWLFARQDLATNINFGPRLCSEVRRQFIIPLWNVYSFFVTYANLDGWTLSKFEQGFANQTDEMDRWITAELDAAIGEVTGLMEDWRIDLAVLKIERFVDRLSNWYVRRSRRRFWKGGDDADKLSAYATLYHCLVTLSRLLAPFTPFVAESIHRNLVAQRRADAPASVHLTDWPAPAQAPDEALLGRMEAVVRLVELGRRARGRAKVKVRQPLRRALYRAATPAETEMLDNSPELTAIVADELNIKGVERIGDEMLAKLNRVTLIPKFAKLGPKHGSAAQRIKQLLAAGDADAHLRWERELAEGGEADIGGGFKLAPEDVDIQRDDVPGYTVVNEGGYTLALYTELDDELRNEGLARELVHQIQNMRRQQGLEISDRIALTIAAPPELRAALEPHREYICDETLATEFGWNEPASGSAEVVLEQHRAQVALKRVDG